MSELAVLGIRVEAGQVVATTAALNGMTAAGAKAEGATNRLSSAAKSLGIAVGTYLSARALLSGFEAIARATREAELSQVRLEGVLRSTGNRAGYTASQLSELADVMSRGTLFDDEAIKNAAARLATFGNITGAVFERTLTLGADLATLLGEDITGATFQLGRALEDPVRGLTLLQRSGVSLSEAERDMVREAIKHNDVRRAQTIILDALQAKVGGLAGASTGGLTGSMHQLRLAWGNFLEGLGQTEGFAGTAARAIALVADAVEGLLVALAPTRAMQEEVLRGTHAGATRTLGAMAAQGPTVGETQAGYLMRMGRQAAVVDDLARRIDALRAASVAEMRARSAAMAVADAHARSLRAVTEGTNTTTDATKEMANAYKTLRTAIEQKVAAQEEERAKLGEVAEANRKQWETMRDLVAEYAADLERGRELTKAAAEGNGEALRTMLKDMQRALSSFFADIFTTGVPSFRRLFEEVRGLWSKMLADMAAQRLRVAFENVPTGGKVDTAALGSAAQIGVAGIFAGLIAGMFESARAAREAAAAERELAAARAKTFLASYERAQLEWIFPTESLDKAVGAVGDQFRELIRLAEEAGGASAAQIPRIREMWAEMEKRARAEYALRQREAQEDYAVRALRAVGMDAEADAAAFALEQQRELAQAIRDGADAATLAVLAETQRAEAIRRTAEVSIAAAQKEADAAASRLATAQSALDATRATLAGLNAYSASLRGLGGTPASNLARSRADFEALATRARAGDQTAIAGLQGAGTTFLEQSRAYNASGMGYQRDVASVQAVVDAVAATYQATADAQQQVVDLLTEQNRLAAAALRALQDAEFVRQHAAATAYYAAAYTAAQAAGDQTAMLAALSALRGLALAQAARATTDLLALQGTFNTTGQAIIAAQILAIQTQATTTGAAFDRAAAAIVAGFPSAEIGNLYTEAQSQSRILGGMATLVQHQGMFSALGTLTETGMRNIFNAVWDLAHPAAIPPISIGRPLDPDTNEPLSFGATNTLLGAGFTTLDSRLQDIETAIGELTRVTRRTGETGLV